jgi:hypothetical protein
MVGLTREHAFDERTGVRSFGIERPFELGQFRLRWRVGADGVWLALTAL